MWHNAQIDHGYKKLVKNTDTENIGILRKNSPSNRESWTTTSIQTNDESGLHAEPKRKD